MKILHEIVEQAGRFFIEESNQTIAELDFELHKENTLLITHTAVDKSFEGKGIGRQLVIEAVEYARNKLLIIKVTCPFAKKILDRSNEFSDVYQKDNHKNA